MELDTILFIGKVLAALVLIFVVYKGLRKNSEVNS